MTERTINTITISLLLLFIIFTIGCAVPSEGIKGRDGSSCSVQSAINGALILCTDGTSSLITHGVDGLNGEDGQDGIDGRDGLDGRDGVDSIVELIDPCGDNPGQFDEVIIKLSTGELLAYFESSGNRFLSILKNGSYRTTDSQSCHFVVHNGTINY